MTPANEDTGAGGMDETLASDLRAIEWELSEIVRRIETLRQQLQAIHEQPKPQIGADDHPRGAL